MKKLDRKQVLKSLKKVDGIWLSDPEAHDFPAAKDFLELLFSVEEAKKISVELKRSKTIYKKAKDIFRASGLSILPEDNYHVQKDFEKAMNGDKLSPILLVRHLPHLIIADGFHRLCCSYYLSEDLDIPCRLV